ncbi:DNA-binding transcriptional MerR regulator [Catenibacillus scindens]|uniref:DNA-binding transcriptional MerR regulator n=1 Tax=Catenibacillus scindens TaxID=673271 RepID=A0A7W8HA18_9FIRM|nr:MerR family transcriptional regulator [Catenibacillus scindens]MBB5263885.1 DNA-binding transcriptional MerR regulator [Catenibacillus scindens]
MSETRYIISDAAKMINVEPHVLRYWEEELGMDIPRNEMGHRYYTDKEVRLFTQVRDLKEKGFQLKAIKMILSTLSEDMPASNIISLDKVRKNYADETFLEGEAARPAVTSFENRKVGSNNSGADPYIDGESGGNGEMSGKTEYDHDLEGERGADIKSVPAPVSKSNVESIEKNSLDPDAKSSLAPAASVQSPSQTVSAQDKMKHFKYIMDGIVTQALKKNNTLIETQVTEKILKEMDYLFRVQDEKAEERFRNLDEMIRKKQRGRKEAAAARMPAYKSPRTKKGLFGRKDVF